MPTRRGWGLLGSAIPMLVVGRLLRIVELYVLAVTVCALAGLAVAYVRLRRANVVVKRDIHPPRVAAGGSSRVDLELRNQGSRTTPVLLVRDPFDNGWRWARFLVPPVSPGASSRAAYRLPTDKRGIYDIGPMEVSVNDPFGLAVEQSEAVGLTQLTVYPRIDRVLPPPLTLGRDPHSGADHPTALTGQGDDFYALREYQVGDDTRRIHWPSTARLGELMIRQDEMPWQTRATILLDVRAAVHTEDSLEVAVSAAASVHDACRRQTSLTRLMSTEGTDSGFSDGHAHDEAILEHLASVQATREDRLAGACASLRKAGNGGALVAIMTTAAPPRDLQAVAGLRGRYGTIVLVLVDHGSSMRGPGQIPAVSVVVRVTRSEPFAVAWDKALNRELVRR